MWFLSLGLILFGGGLIGYLLKKVRLPSLIGYLGLGMLLAYLGLMDQKLLDVSSEIRKIALMVILLKAGLSLGIDSLKKVGRPALLMSFVPAVAEMCAVGLLAPSFLGLSYTEGFLLGSVLGAVSPAVVVPRMSKMIEEGYGTKKGIPQLIIAGSSLDDIVMIVFFTSFMTIEKGSSLSFMTFLNIPISIVSGVAVGVLLGFAFSLLWKHVHMRDSLKLALIMGVGALLVYLEDYLGQWFSFSSLLALIAMGIVILARRKEVASRIAKKCEKLWTVAEIFLFVLVGASIRFEAFGQYALISIGLLALSLIARSLGVQASLIKTKLNLKERLYVTISYLPKATVQAAIGGSLLDYASTTGNEALIKAGTIVLSVSVMSIILTAPLSAFLMDISYKRLTEKEEVANPQE